MEYTLSHCNNEEIVKGGVANFNASFNSTSNVTINATNSCGETATSAFSLSIVSYYYTYIHYYYRSDKLQLQSRTTLMTGTKYHN